MAIASRQLESWSQQGGTAASTAAYNSIQHALTKSDTSLVGRGVEIFLQGSYANATNTRGDSDIDVVVLYDKTFFKDLTALSYPLQQSHEARHGVADYQWHELQRDVLAALRAHYGSAAVQTGKKSLKVTTGHGRMTADVVPAMQYRRYATYQNETNFTAYWGICFFDSGGNLIVNFPKYHIDNGRAKNKDERTGGRYKAHVRLFKNFRSHMVDNGVLLSGTAPSYFIECMLYNVPDILFRGDFSNTVPAILNHLWTASFPSLKSQNAIIPLIGVEPTQWHQDNYTRFLTAARAVWSAL